MQNTLPEQHTWWQALKDLDFLSSFFSWFFMLLTRLSEPLMLLSTLYVVAETGVPPIASPALHNLAIGIMITAPELILPGAFVVAARAQQYARWLLAVCCAFVVLTLITLVSLFVWHFTGQALAWLMCARCAAAVGYSILMRVMNHGQRVNQTVQAIPVPNVQVLVQEIRENIEHLQSGNIEQVQRINANTECRMAERMQRTVTELTTQYQRTGQEIEQRIATLVTPKPVAISARCEQFGPFAHVEYRTPTNYSEVSDFELREYGMLPVQNAETHVSEQRAEQEIEQREAVPEQRLRIVKTVKKPVRKVKKERGNALELVTHVLQANPRATLSEIVNQTGISRGHASTLRTQVLNSRDFA